MKLDTKFAKHEVRAMANVTISMDDATLAWARVQAAREGLSLSRWLGTRLAGERADSDDDARRRRKREALERILAAPALELDPGPLPTREEINDDALGDTLWFVDTNVLVYSRTSSDLTKQMRARAWLQAIQSSGEIILSPQIINETCSVLLRKSKGRPQQHGAIREFARELLPWCEAPLNADIIDQALFLHERHHISWWDCPMVASAIEVGADYLLSEDLQDERRFGRLQIVNPFRIAPGDFLAALA